LFKASFFAPIIYFYSFVLILFFIFSGWIVKGAIVLVVLVVGACGLVGCATCFYHCCKRVCSYKCPTLPTVEVTWFASSDDARQARTMLARAKFAPINLRPRRVKSAKKVSKGYLPVVFCSLSGLQNERVAEQCKTSFFIPKTHLNIQICS